MPALHDWNLTAQEAADLQRTLAPRVVIARPPAPWPPALVAGVDVTPFPGDEERFLAGIVVVRLPDLGVVEEVTAAHPAGMPYRTGLLSFREGPAILAAAGKLTSRPGAFVFDGHGVMHPRRFGLACHMGLWLDVPSAGCGKTHLLGTWTEPAAPRGSTSDITVGDEVVGAVLRTRDGVNPVFASAGHRVDLAGAVELLLACSRYRVPEPTRLAHLLVNRAVGRLPAK